MMSIFKTKSTSEKLKADAVTLGLCAQWQREWGNPTKDELCKKYITGLDFCIRHDFPRPAYMKANFEGVMQRHGIFVDDAIRLNNEKLVIANGGTCGEVTYDGYSVGQIYARHTSSLKIFVSGHAIVNVRCYDHSCVTVVCKDATAKASVIMRGGNIETVGSVKIIDRRTNKNLMPSCN